MLRRLDEREAEHAERQELLAEPPKEDLHPRLHEDTLRALARAVQLDEPIQERLERVLRRQADVPRTDLALEATRLRLISWRSFEGRRSRYSRTSRARGGTARRRSGPRAPRWRTLRRSRLDEELQPWLVLGQAAQVGLRPVVGAAERREQLLRDGGPCLRQRDGAHVVGHLGPAEEPQGPVEPLERHRTHLVPVLLGERQQQVVRLVRELLPVDLQEARRVEERSRRIARTSADQSRRAKSRGSWLKTMSIACEPRGRSTGSSAATLPGASAPTAATAAGAPPLKPLEPEPAGVDAIVPLVVTANESMLSAK